MIKYFIIVVSSCLLALSTATSISTASVRDIALGERCDNDPGWCADGLECVGPTDRKRCFPRGEEGDDCKIPYNLCVKGLKCRRGTCTKVLLDEGDSCNKKNAMCKEPFSCVGRRGNKRCYEKGDVGASCGSEPFWVCKDHLKCKNGECKKVLLKRGASCNEPDDECKPPLSCVGDHGDKRCYKKRKEGQTCEDPFWVCEHGLVCNDDGLCEDPYY